MDGLKATLSFDAFAYDYDDEYLTIDTDTHTININNVSRLFGVQYDGNSKLIKFRIRNKLSDIQKMQDSIVYINWIDSRGVKGQSIAINKTINNDTCEFAWKVPFDALKNSGVLHFAMSAVMTKNSSSVIDQRWSTRIASVITPDGIYIKSYTPSSEEEDRIAQIYNELSNMINKQNDNLQSQVNSLKEGIDDIRTPSELNIWDEEWESGSIEPNGTTSQNSARIRSKNFIPCEESKDYFLFSNGYGIFVYFYDENKQYLSKNTGTENNGLKNEIFKTPENTSYIKFRTNDDYGAVYKKDFSINSNLADYYIPYLTAYDKTARINIDKLDISLKKATYNFVPLYGVNGVNNGVQSIQDNVITKNGFQFVLYVNNEQKLCIAKRKIESVKWDYVTIGSTIKRDNHYYCSMGIDRKGYIHVAYGMHVTPLRYMISNAPYTITGFHSSKMTGLYEDKVSYPTFFNKKDGALMFIYRNTVFTSSNKDFGIISLNVYSENDATWGKVRPKIIDGASYTVNPYLNHIAIDKKTGTIHISGTFRTLTKGNQYIFYAKSDDGGRSWKKSDNTTYTLPINYDTSEKIADITAVPNGLLNQNGMCVDDDGNPHIIYFCLNNSGYTELFHLYFNGNEWKNDQVSDFKYRIEPNLTAYTSQLSRPSIFSYKNKNYVLYRHNFTESAGKLMLKCISDNTNNKPVPVCDVYLNDYEPCYDTNAIYDGYLHMLVVRTTTEISESKSENIAYTTWDSWKNQFSGIVNINLDRVDDFINGNCRIVSEKLISSSKDTMIAINKNNNKMNFIKVTLKANDNLVDNKFYLKAKSNNTITTIATIPIYKDNPLYVESPKVPMLLTSEIAEYFVESENDGKLDYAIIMMYEIVN